MSISKEYNPLEVTHGTYLDGQSQKNMTIHLVNQKDENEKENEKLNWLLNLLSPQTDNPFNPLGSNQLIVKSDSGEIFYVRRPCIDKTYGEVNVDASEATRFSYSDYFGGLRNLGDRVDKVLKDVSDSLRLKDFNDIDFMLSGDMNNVESEVILALLRLTYKFKSKLPNWDKSLDSFKVKLKSEGKDINRVLAGIDKVVRFFV